MHLAPLIRDLAVILGIAGLVSLVFHRIRQPVVLGYLIAGFIIGPHSFSPSLVSDLPNIQIWADLGVVFLMFTLGLEFSFRKLAKVGISVSITAVIEVMSMLFVGYGLGRALDWGHANSIFLGATMSISSTTIIIRALDELGLKTRRFAEMIFGMLIVEDLIAILILVSLSTLAATKVFSGSALLFSGAKLLLVVGTWFIMGYFALPRFVRYVGRLGSDELLTILSLGLCLSLVVAAHSFDYSVALGAFIMGSILAESTESRRIEELMMPLRDLFSAVFFVSVGMLIEPAAIAQHWPAILLISAVLIVGKSTFTILGALATGQTFRTAVQVGLGLTQIGEFSFIIAGLGRSLDYTSDFLFPIAVAVSLLTTFTTPTLFKHSHEVARWLELRLPIKVRQFLTRYAAWTHARHADSARRSAFYRLAMGWLVNGILVTVSFVGVSEWGLPWLAERFEHPELRAGLGWLAAMLISGPFFWGMLVTFKSFRFSGADESAAQEASAVSGGTLLVSRLIAIVWISGLSVIFFPPRFALILAAVLCGSFFLLFRSQLSATYHWFERQFLSTFTDPAKTAQRRDIFRELAPWDAHLVRLKVHPNSELAGKRIAETELRKRFGVSIVVIQRGLKTIVATSPHELIFPKDELLVLGTDEQVERARVLVERPPGLSERFSDLSGYQLREILVRPESPIGGKSIRDSGIRDIYGGILVGIERGGRRILNPESDLSLEAGDVIWVVGENEKLDRLV